MKKIISILGILIFCMALQVVSQNAPVTTAASVVSTTTSALVPVTVTGFTNIVSFNLKILYDPSVVSATAITIGPVLGGSLSTNLTVPGEITLGWFAYPGKSMADNSVMFTVTFSKLTSGSSAISWFDDGYSCVWYDGNFATLNDLPTPAYYINGSVTFPPPLVADFTVSSTTPPKNTTVQFTDLTTGNPATWSWSFDRTSVVYVNGTSAASKNPQVQFNDGGLYTVTLVVTNEYFTETKIKTAYILAGIGGLWSGGVSSDWNNLANWDNHLVPDAATNVVIPSSAIFWPVFNGNLTLGTNCKNLTLSGTTSRMTINGDLTIKP